MPLTSDQISQNYKKCFDLAVKLIAQSNRTRGYEIDKSNQQLIDLAQSVTGDENIVRLIQDTLFNPPEYEPALRAAIDTVKNELFFDVNKKRFLSLDKHNLDFLIYNNPSETETVVDLRDEDQELKLLNILESKLSQNGFTYLKNRILPQISDWQIGIRRLFHLKNIEIKEQELSKIENKIKLIRRFYPKGNIPVTSNLDGREPLDEKQIINCYKNVYIEIEPRFPPYFLQNNGQRRAALLTRFLIEEILQSNPETILKQKNETFFIRHKLQNIYRLFNYSANRALGNAYPALIPPWLHSRAQENYWEKEENRMHAIRWLVEKRIGITAQCFRKAYIPRKVFAENGLSYMFNKYYNSVSKALKSAYPAMEPWELGSVPLDYWTEENSARAVRWIIDQNNWQPNELAGLVRKKIFTRKTFSEFGLATLFEKKFGKNIFSAVSIAYPGKFHPWQFGNVASDYWDENKNIYHASKWIVRQEGIDEKEIPKAVRSKRINFNIFKKYSIDAALKRLSKGSLERLFEPYFWREHRRCLEEYKLLFKLNGLIRSEKGANFFTNYLLYGFFTPAVQRVSNDYAARYERMFRRIQRRK